MAIVRVSGATKGTGRPAKPAKVGKIARAGQRPPVDLTELSLPDAPSEPVLDLRRYITMLYGPPGVGKTTFLGSIPKLFVIATEAGSKGMAIFQRSVATWPEFMRYVELIEAEPTRFNDVAVDTIDRLFDICTEWVLQQLGTDALGKDSEGNQDRGASYTLLNTTIRDALQRLYETGIGLWIISHSKDMTIKTRSGSTYDKLCCSLSDSKRNLVEAFCDFIFSVDFAKNSEGHEIRYMITSGDDRVTAKAREIAGRTLPKYIELHKQGAYDHLRAVWNGESEGLDAKTLMPSKRSSKAGGAMLQTDYVEARVRPKRKIIGKQGS